MIRLFAALAVPGDAAEALASHQGGLPGARWSPAENLHITLRFFGEMSEDRADDLDLELSRISGRAMAVEAAGVGAFGEGDDVRAVWARVGADPAMEQLARRCESAARRVGLKPEARAWRPHITLAYLRRPDPAAVAAWLQANALLRLPTFQATAFGLYSSWRNPRGSEYRLERLYRLGARVT